MPTLPVYYSVGNFKVMIIWLYMYQWQLLDHCDAVQESNDVSADFLWVRRLPTWSR